VSSSVALVHRAFDPGEEDEARALLAARPRVRDLVISREALRPRSARGMFVFMFAIFFCVASVMNYVLFSMAAERILGSYPGIFAISVAIGAFGWLSGRIVFGSAGPLLVCGHDGFIELGGRRVASFDELGVPRLDEVHCEWTLRLDMKQKGTLPSVVMDRGDGEPLVLFGRNTNPRIVRRLPEIAEHINALLLEHHYRNRVRRWLDRREADRDTASAYRREQGPS
jgi:hypothetical protein